MKQQTFQKRTKIRPRRLQETLLLALGRQEAPTRPQDAPKTFPRRPFGGVLGAWRLSWAEKGAQDGPKLAPKTEAKSVLGRPGGVLGASWRRHVADFMHF